jgi:UDP:flavonoid glycosyltransferase YjiC (YdhE family)
LGHASRCVPIVHALKLAGFEPVFAGDGEALQLLQKEFPSVKSYRLPSYAIKYAKRGYFLKFKLLLSLPRIFSAILKENKAVKEIIEKENICGIISDNRPGVFHNAVPSVYVTHQITVFSGFTTLITSKIHQYFIRKFTICWVPDFEDDRKLSGKMGQGLAGFPVKYIGILSKLKLKNSIKKKYQIAAVLSGPEPQRSALEKIMLTELTKFNEKALLVRGILSENQEKRIEKNITIYNFLLGEDLETALNSSDTIIARSGYSTIMDMAVLGKKAFFIPTPGQTEQIYLAKTLQQKKIAPYCNQNEFSIEKLEQIAKYEGFKQISSTLDLEIFNLFKSETKS